MDDKFSTETVNIEVHLKHAPVSAVKSRILPLDERPYAYNVNDQSVADYDAFLVNICGRMESFGYTIEEEQEVRRFDDYVICIDHSATGNAVQIKYAIHVKIADDLIEQFIAAANNNREKIRFDLKYITVNHHTCDSYESALDCLEDILDHREINPLTYCTALINPRLCNKYNLSVEIEQRISEDELRDFPVSIPHMRICLDPLENPEQYAYVRLDKPEYLAEDKPADISKKKAEIIDVLSSPWNHHLIQSQNTNQVRTATGYEAAVSIWIDTYGDNVAFREDVFTYDENGFPIMPDYAIL